MPSVPAIVSPVCQLTISERKRPGVQADKYRHGGEVLFENLTFDLNRLMNCVAEETCKRTFIELVCSPSSLTGLGEQSQRAHADTLLSFSEPGNADESQQHEDGTCRVPEQTQPEDAGLIQTHHPEMRQQNRSESNRWSPFQSPWRQPAASSVSNLPAWNTSTEVAAVEFTVQGSRRRSRCA